MTLSMFCQRGGEVRSEYGKCEVVGEGSHNLTGKESSFPERKEGIFIGVVNGNRWRKGKDVSKIVHVNLKAGS